MLEEGDLEPFRVQICEAKARDPNVPQGKAFASLSTLHLGLNTNASLTCEILVLAHHCKYYFIIVSS